VPNSTDLRPPMDRPHEAKDVVLRVFVKALAKRVGNRPQNPTVYC